MSSGNILVVNATHRETRVALVEQDMLTEFYVERRGERGIVGNIYKARVMRVLPGMQAAFVDIGQEKAAFLYVSDVYNEHRDYTRNIDEIEGARLEALARSEAEDPPSTETSSNDEVVNATESSSVKVAEAPTVAAENPTPDDALASTELALAIVDDVLEGDVARSMDDADASVDPDSASDERPAPSPRGWSDPLPTVPQSRGRYRPTGPIEERLYEGQEILVQVAKEPIGTKGARITSHITLPGRQLVHMPTFDHIGVSRRIEDEDERQRLRDIVDALRQPRTGFIVRTASENLKRSHLARDIEYLTTLWRDILEQYQNARAPALLYADLDLVTRAARDLLTDDIDALIIDDIDEWERTQRFVERFMPRRIDAVQLYQKHEPIFDSYGLEIEVERALDKKVWLKSGGYLVIEQTEALTAIDVNTGKFVGKHTLEDTILQINLEAVKEICYQLRLRNIGGLIIIDFIDMEKLAHREKIFQAVEDGLKRDKAKTNVLKISEFGLLEMTRKRVRESLSQSLCEPCHYCEGKGYIKSRQSVAYEILRHIRRELPNFPQGSGSVQVIAHRDVAHVLYEEERQAIEGLERAWNKRIDLKTHPHFHIEQYEITERT